MTKQCAIYTSAMFVHFLLYSSVSSASVSMHLSVVHLFPVHLEGVVGRQGRPVALRYSQIKPGHRPLCFFLVTIVIIITKDRDKHKIKPGHRPFATSLLSLSLSLSSI